MELYRHGKTGEIYEVICNAYFEWEPTTLAVVYRNKATGERWIRPSSEFNDGRFVRVDQNPHDTEGSCMTFNDWCLSKFKGTAWNAAYIEGQKAMRERAAEYISDKWDFLGEELVVSDAIRAMPVEGE